jgi:hypothetical protein
MFERSKAVVSGLGLFGAVASLPAGSSVAHAEEPPLQCVGFQQSVQENKTIEYEVENGCEKKQACSLSWTIQCENDKGKATDRSRKSERFVLAPSSKKAVSLSAESCKQSWRIEEVTWQCDDVK